MNWDDIIRIWKEEAFGKNGAITKMIAVEKKGSIDLDKPIESDHSEEYTIITDDPEAMKGHCNVRLNKYQKLLEERGGKRRKINVIIKFVKPGFYF